jgi:hypothetical protein
MDSTDPTNAVPNSRARTSNSFSDIILGRRKRRSERFAPRQTFQNAGRPRRKPGPVSLPTSLIVIQSPALGGDPVIHVPADLVLSQTIPPLNLALELIPPAVDDVKVIVSELTPLFFDLTFHLLPISFDAIPIHYLLSSLL